MDDPPKFQAIHDDAIAANTPLDAFVQKKLKAQEDWLRRYDGEHMSRRIWTDPTEGPEPTGPFRASVPWASLDSQILELRPGALKLQCDIGCMVTSAENPGEAGVEWELELIGIGSTSGVIAPSVDVTEWKLETISLDFPAPLQLDAVVPAFLWFRSQFETTVLDTFEIRSTTADFGETDQNVFNTYNPAGLYVIEQLDGDGNVTWTYDMYDSQGNRLFFAHPMVRVEQEDNQEARIKALGYIALAGVDWRVIYDGV